MDRRDFLGLAGAAAISAALSPASFGQGQRLPNIVIIFTDDQGYGDLGCYGSKTIKTPNIDRLAREGRRFTDFYVPQAVCSASRAGLLTGCYPNRIGIGGALGPGARHGIGDGEMTIAELLKQKNYATAIFGKWHLGDHPQFLPLRHGFDEYLGLPYSNDMWPNHPTNKSFPPLPLIEGDKPVEIMPDQAQLTTRFTGRAVQFIEKSAGRPFFLYVPHPMPHVPLFVSDRFKGKSAGGLYGDVIEEIDWSVGQIMEALRRQGLEDNTLVIFTSDNGPWLSYGDHAGSSGPLREGKATAWEGGVRVPCIMRFPGRIPASTVSSEPAMTIDLLPTIAGLTGTRLPEHTIDGRDIWPVISGDGRSPHEAYYFYWGQHLQAVRSGRWKLHFPHGYPSVNAPGSEGLPGRMSQQKVDLALFDLSVDPGETTDIADQHPDVVARLSALAQTMRDDLGDSAQKRQGKGIRPPGRL
jgi:arylsulfatase A